MKHIDQMLVNVKVAQALLQARLAMDMIQNCTLEIDGDKIRMDHTWEIGLIDDALEAIGVDPNEPAQVGFPPDLEVDED